MPNYIIATSSTSDLPRTYLDAHQIPFIAYSYTVGEQMFEDDCREETRLSVYQGMRSGDRLRTSMINACTRTFSVPCWTVERMSFFSICRRRCPFPMRIRNGP